MLFAENIKKFCAGNKIPMRKISVIGSHGQTVCHRPESNPPHTLQIGEPSFIAETSQTPVAADFRPADMAAGGQGAPLIPFLDEYLFGDGPAKLLQNIGGIGNISIVGKGIKTIGFDTGPGNCLMDTAVRIATNGRMGFDKNGMLALKGRIDLRKAGTLLQMPFFRKSPPKSLDREDFGIKFIRKNWPGLSIKNLENTIATLNYFTAKSIEISVKKFIKPKASEMVVSGGGALNPALMKNLKTLLSPIKVKSILEYGIHPLAKEPACFALMAYLALKGENNHCPSATGAKGIRILGKIINSAPRKHRQ